jgi:hypothetical protein
MDRNVLGEWLAGIAELDLMGLAQSRDFGYLIYLPTDIWATYAISTTSTHISH